MTALTTHVIPFFNRFMFLSAKKKRDFSKFKHIVQLMQQGAHLHHDGIRQILAIRRDMNDGGAKRRKYSDAEILHLLEARESSETTR